MRRFIIALAKGYKNIRLFLLKIRKHTPQTHAAKRMAHGKSWDDFCDTLKAAGATVLAHPNIDERTQAEGYRYLSRLTRAGLEAFVEYADPKAPVLKRMVHETVKMGADNPDNYYQNAVVSGEYDYKITGTRGTVHFLYFSTQTGGYGKGGDLPPSGTLHSKNLVVDPNGKLEIIVSAKKQAGNWLPMEKETGLLMVRQTFLNRETETAAELFIERIGGTGMPSECTAFSMDEKLMNACNLVAGASFLFSRWTKDFQKHKNKLPQFDPQKSTSAGGDPNIAYYHSFWELGEGEALIIDAHPPTCEQWNFQLNNYWMESLDYRYFRIHINKHTATYNPDGSVRVVVAHKNPGHPNWLTTTGLPQGTMCWRWIHAETHPAPQTRVVSFDDFTTKFSK